VLKIIQNIKLLLDKEQNKNIFICMFAELSIISNFTFLTGASHPEEYMMRAALLGLPAIAIADVN